MSKKEALEQIVAKSANKKRIGKVLLKSSMLAKMMKKKLSIASKPSASSMPSMTAKPSVKKKAVMKKDADKPSKLEFKAVKKDIPAKKSDDAIGDELHDWIGKGVRVVSEKAGPLKYGRSGSVSNVKDGTASIMTEKGVISTQMEFLMLEDATWKKPRAYRTFQYITRASLQSMLQV